MRDSRLFVVRSKSACASQHVVGNANAGAAVRQSGSDANRGNQRGRFRNPSDADPNPQRIRPRDSAGVSKGRAKSRPRDC